MFRITSVTAKLNTFEVYWNFAAVIFIHYAFCSHVSCCTYVIFFIFMPCLCYCMRGM